MVLEEIFTKRKLGPNKNCRVKIPQIMWRFSSHFLWLWKKMWKDFRLSCFCSTAINIANKLKVDDYVSILHLSVCLSVCWESVRRFNVSVLFQIIFHNDFMKIRNKEIEVSCYPKRSLRYHLLSCHEED